MVHEHTDRASGKSGDRNQFKAMFEDASKREFDVLLFWSLDRLCREGTVEMLNHLRRLTHYGVHWRSFTEQYLDSTGIFREAVIGILAAVAKQERIRISERVKAGPDRARKQGRIGGRPRSEEDLRLMAQVRKLRTSGMSIRTIAQQLGQSPTTITKLVAP
jgi:DNA invertase Pin-like site-specific DNA recombinase